MRRRFSIIVAFVASAMLAGQAHGQSCGLVFFLQCAGGPYDHTLPSSPDGMWKFPHNDCALCVVDFSECHPSCNATDADPRTKAAYSAIIRAARNGDVAAVVGLASQAPGYVSLVPERAAVQVRNCTRTGIIANLPLRDFGILLSALRLSHRFEWSVPQDAYPGLGKEQVVTGIWVHSHTNVP